jgi:hypothetical protein
MACRLPRNVIFVNREPKPVAQRCESQQYGRESHFVSGSGERLSERVFTCLYRAGMGGELRDPEGAKTALPGRS